MKFSETLTMEAKERMFRMYVDVRKLNGLDADFEEFCKLLDENIEVAITLMKAIIG